MSQDQERTGPRATPSHLTKGGALRDRSYVRMSKVILGRFYPPHLLGYVCPLWGFFEPSSGLQVGVGVKVLAHISISWPPLPMAIGIAGALLLAKAEAI